MSRRKHKHGGHVNHERWLITYADLITLLLVFFIVMYAMSKVEQHKFDEVAQSLQSAFHVTAGGSEAVLPPASSEVMPNAGAAVMPERQQQMELQEEIEKAISQKFGESTLKDVSTSINQRGLVISLANQAFFAPGSADLLPKARGMLKSLVPMILESGRPLQVEGHTDDTPIHSARFPTNWELSTARATSVVRFLAESGRVPPTRLSAAGYGEYYPLAPNTSAENRSKNRRVDLVLLSSDAAQQRPGIF